MASYCDEELCCQKSLELFWAQVLPKEEGEIQRYRDSKLYLEMVWSHKQRFEENVELVKVASHQTKVKREEQEEQEVQNREQEETKDIWQETRNEKQETKYEQPESEKQKSTVGEKTKAERETEEDSLDFNWAGVNFSGRDAVASEKDIELGDEETRPDRQKGNNGRGLMIMSITCDKTMIGGMSATIFILAVTIGYFAWP